MALDIGNVDKNPLNRMRNYETQIKKETAVQKEWDGCWGFMKAPSEDLVPRQFDSVLAKYYSKGITGNTEATVKTKRVPPSTETEEVCLVKPKETMTNTRPQRADGIQLTTYEDYGRAANLELFGVSEQGRGKLTKLPDGKSITKNYRWV
eukprot:CAMPEP_0196720110 /NCGR_PEP_ID=MMETSP1091-20130531/2952_1 /TAXON_ID=302021 /ORGANISM="Rhodomonas sp., Strain CCMP768" /LENGTH=149 /DNA_ID=CAMNT_0042061231 /DNA_START=17 /DNA_END=466 /DNA_ORIENTATION=+